ncbi:CPBP family intramembrane glutamic endopeptidase [Halocatena marina]|uniref:CPBP family intramembrane glutamic endopeptidase n=1 Tax=Halocatena marina TaxID=2934937 RepID=UPI0036F427C4
MSETPEALLVMIPVTILLIGPGEELLFRGIIQGSLRERFGPIVAIVLASVIFAAAHVTSLTGGLESRIITVALLIVPALVFAIAYERTGNLVVPALIHGLYNATLFSLQYAAIKLGEHRPYFCSDRRHNTDNRPVIEIERQRDSTGYS